MKTLHYSIIAVLVICGTVSPAWAYVDFKAYLPMGGTSITPEFNFTKNIIIDYSNGGKLKDALMGKHITLQFSDTSNNNTSVKSLMGTINSDFITERKSNAIISNLRLDYQVQINGGDKNATFDYVIKLVPTVNNYTLYKGFGSAPTTFGISWMGFVIKDPVIITTKQYGYLEINSPLGAIKNQLPYVYNLLKGTPVENALNLNLLDASALLKYPIDKWNSLFDPTFAFSKTTGYGYPGKTVGVTEFSFGPNDLYQVYWKPVTNTTDFTTDSKYNMTVIERPSSSIIDVEGLATGYVVPNKVQDNPAIATKPTPSYSIEQRWLNFEQESILVLFVISVVVAVFVFNRHRRGIKKIALFIWIPIILTFIYTRSDPLFLRSIEATTIAVGIGFYLLSGVYYLFYRAFSRGWKNEKAAFVLIMLVCMGMFGWGLNLLQIAIMTSFWYNGGIPSIFLIGLAISLGLITFIKARKST